MEGPGKGGGCCPWGDATPGVVNDEIVNRIIQVGIIMDINTNTVVVDIVLLDRNSAAICLNTYDAIVINTRRILNNISESLISGK